MVFYLQPVRVVARPRPDSGKDPILRGLEGALSAGALTNVVRKGEEFEEGDATGKGTLTFTGGWGTRNH